MRLRYKVYLATALLIVVGAVVVWRLYPKPTVYRTDFELGFDVWTEDADLPQDPNEPGSSVAWHVSRVASTAHSGQYSAEMYIDGRQDDGTVWIEKRVPVESDRQVRVEVSFAFYSEQESFNVVAGVCAYVGTSNPTVEADFMVIGNANEVAGWKRYSHAATFQTGSSEQAWVAVGITVRWETEMTYNFDDIEIVVT
ncbi:MAG: hypothetical protein JSV87_00750 [Candidatus Bathyarchaeota archaeon]|nr:MAG: hypothetical protein JSV87_00750 [Candidatus Bathyarchaeota archaeon]